MAAKFIPRASFPPLANLPRSYFLGHHAKALAATQQMRSGLDLFIEVRDYRLPLTSSNPLLERIAIDKPHYIVYTKQDTGSSHSPAERERDNILREWHHPSRVFFFDATNTTSRRSSLKAIVSSLKEFLAQRESMVAARTLIMGMPNVGKSTLINSIRKYSMRTPKKAAKTGHQPGVTRSMSNHMKLMETDDRSPRNTLYTVDSPGVFVPYVDDPEEMLKLTLCGLVKDSVISPVIVADYCLYRINLIDPQLYKDEAPPTNDIVELLVRLARKLGRINQGGEPDLESAARWFIRAWQTGTRGKFILDDVSQDTLRVKAEMDKSGPISLSQAKKIYKQDMLEQKRAVV